MLSSNILVVLLKTYSIHCMMSDAIIKELLTPSKPLGESCGYASCPVPQQGFLNVHIVPHTHGELGQTQTFYSYFTGGDDIYEPTVKNMKRILDFTISELWAKSNRKFTFSDMPYLFYWWARRDETVRRMVYELLRQGRLYLIGGGWSMSDEASTSYHAIIDHFTYSLRKVNSSFMECGRPLVAWQADSVGHSREFASLMAQMGYDGLFIAPVGFDEELNRLQRREMEFLWRGSDDLGAETDIFTHILFDGVDPPPGFCFSSLCDDPLLITSSETLANFIPRVDAFIDSMVHRQSPYYSTKNVLVGMGGRLAYFDASMWFENMDKLIHLVNQRSLSQDKRVFAFYSTPACYLKAVYDESPMLNTKQDDFHPQAMDMNSFATGGYTTRPSIKYLAREGHRYLQISKQLHVTAKLWGYDQFFEDFNWIHGVFQDHHIMPGEVWPQVMQFYTKRMDAVMQQSLLLLQDGFNKLRESPPTTRYFRCRFNSSDCVNSSGPHVFVVVYNPLAWPVTVPIRLPIRQRDYVVYSPKVEKVTAATMMIPQFVQQLPGRNCTLDTELIFYAKNLPPLGYRSYYFQRRELGWERPKRSLIKKINQKKPKKYLVRQTNISPDDNILLEPEYEYFDDGPTSTTSVPRIETKIQFGDVSRNDNDSKFSDVLTPRSRTEGTTTDTIIIDVPETTEIYTNKDIESTKFDDILNNCTKDNKTCNANNDNNNDYKSNDIEKEIPYKDDGSTRDYSYNSPTPYDQLITDDYGYKGNENSTIKDEYVKNNNVHTDNENELSRNYNSSIENDNAPSISDNDRTQIENERNDNDPTPNDNENNPTRKYDSDLNSNVEEVNSKISNDNDSIRKDNDIQIIKDDPKLNDHDRTRNDYTSLRNTSDDSKVFNASIDDDSYRAIFQWKNVGTTMSTLSVAGRNTFTLAQAIERMEKNNIQPDNTPDGPTRASIPKKATDSDSETDEERKTDRYWLGFDYIESGSSFIRSRYIRVNLDSSKQIKSISLSNGIELPFQVQFFYYVSDDPARLGKSDVPAPGAYVFRSMDNKQEPIQEAVDTKMYKSKLMQEIHCSLSPYAAFALRLHRESTVIEIDWVVGPIPIEDGLGKDVFIKYVTDLDNAGVFYTDSNGRQTVKRIRNKRATFEPLNKDPVAGNIYPVTSKIYIEDIKRNIRFAVLNDRSQGGSSLKDGEIDLMVHRRLLTEGPLKETMNDTEFDKGVVIRGQHYLYISKADYKPTRVYEKKLAKEIELKPQVFVSSSLAYGRNTKNIWKTQKNEFSGLKKKLPLGIHILTLEKWDAKTILLRLENFLEKSDAVLSGIKTVYLRDLFVEIRFDSVKEMTLAANIELKDWTPLNWKKGHFLKSFNDAYEGIGGDYSDDRVKSIDEVNLDTGIVLEPQQIRTFLLTFEYYKEDVPNVEVIQSPPTDSSGESTS